MKHKLYEELKAIKHKIANKTATFAERNYLIMQTKKEEKKKLKSRS